MLLAQCLQLVKRYVMDGSSLSIDACLTVCSVHSIVAWWHMVAHDVWCCQDGRSKMSKSADSDLSRINLLDDPATVKQKVQKAKTDAEAGLTFDDPTRPEAHNLLSIYHLVTGMSKVTTFICAGCTVSFCMY